MAVSQYGSSGHFGQILDGSRGRMGSCFIFFSVQVGEADKGNVMCPGGQAEEGMGRGFSDVCRSLQADGCTLFHKGQQLALLVWG